MSAHRNLLLVLVVLQTAVLGLLLFDPFDAPARNAGAAHVSDCGVPQGSLPADELRTELRAILRAEIAALRSPGASAAPASSDEADIMLSENELAQREQALAASSSVLRQALTSGVWRAADSQALLQHIAVISPVQRQQLVEEFYAAINRQELKLEDFPPL